MREGEAGQATVELVALLPLLVVIALVVAGLFAGHRAREAADQAAVAGAVAQLQGGDAKRAARDASPDWARPRVHVTGSRVTVVIAPRLPAFMARAIDASRTVIFEAEDMP